MKYAFLGNMNNIAYVFAREMKKQDLDVTLFIDAGSNNILDRPESFDADMPSPYPAWIVELSDIQKKKIQSPFLLFSYKNIYLNLLKDYDVIILNGIWISLGKYIGSNKKVINFFAGFDLDVMADPEKIDYLMGIQRSNFLYRLFKPLYALKYKIVINQQRAGIARADGINYFPAGINPAGDKIIDDIKKGTTYKKLELRGYPFDNAPYHPFIKKNKFVILNFTRFFFLDKTRNDNKRNDIMIEGIADFVNSRKIEVNELEIIFFEKGPDVAGAKKMCDELGISKYIKWQQGVSQNELNKLIINADVVFDQLGSQWLGYGIVAMSIGRPVIANGRPDIFDLITGEKSPVCNAVNAKEVSYWLNFLFDNEEEKIKTGLASSIYIQKHYNIKKTIEFITEI